MSALDDWMQEGQPEEADWSGRILHLAASGDLGHIGKRWLLDLPALTAPYACRSRECTPGLRAPRIRSCCADLSVGLSATERARIEAATPRIADHLRGRDPRWAHHTPTLFDDDALARQDRRCIFAHTSRTSLRCALHEIEDLDHLPRGSLKPIPCQLFPLFVVELDAQRRLLSAVHPKTDSHAGGYPARMYPCLRDPNRIPLYRSCRETLVSLFGARMYGALKRTALRWKRGS